MTGRGFGTYFGIALTVVIGRADDMFFDVLLLSRDVLVLEPGGYGEDGREIVVQDVVRDGDRGVGAVELEDFVAFPALVGREGLGPFGAHSGRRQQINAVLARSAQFPLALNRVGIPVATLADVGRGEVYPRHNVRDGAGNVAQLEGRVREEVFATGSGSVVYSLGDACNEKIGYHRHPVSFAPEMRRRPFLTFPSEFAHPVHLDRHHDRQALAHSAVVSNDRQDMIVARLVVERFRVANGS